MTCHLCVFHFMNLLSPLDFFPSYEFGKCAYTIHIDGSEIFLDAESILFSAKASNVTLRYLTAILCGVSLLEDLLMLLSFQEKKMAMKNPHCQSRSHMVYTLTLHK